MLKTEVQLSSCAVNKPLAVQDNSSIAEKMLNADFSFEILSTAVCV